MTNSRSTPGAASSEPLATHTAVLRTEIDGTSSSRRDRLWQEITRGNALIAVLSVALALLIGAVLIAATNERVQTASQYFFGRPGDTFAAIGDAVFGAYSALFQGAIYNFRRPDFADGIRPLFETLTFATPLIVAGLGIAITFRVGLFNIGGQGQILVAAAAAGWVGSAPNMPWGLHLAFALAAALIAGALWAGIAGALKAGTGANEVITTIMLNYIAFYLVAYLLRTPGMLQAPGSSNPISPATAPTAQLPRILGSAYSVHLGFIIALLAVAGVWWILNRSSLGFSFRAVGLNPSAARVAGMKVRSIYVYAMLISGALVGLAGASQVLGTTTTGFSSGIDAGIGFDALTVALLGRSTPVGVLLAGLLFGALKAGGFSMQADEGVPIDIILVVQSLIVLFIAAPPLVRAIFRLRTPGSTPTPARRNALTGENAK